MVHRWTLSTAVGTCHHCSGHAAIAIFLVNSAFLRFTSFLESGQLSWTEGGWKKRGEKLVGGHGSPTGEPFSLLPHLHVHPGRSGAGKGSVKLPLTDVG